MVKAALGCALTGLFAAVFHNYLPCLALEFILPCLKLRLFRDASSQARACERINAVGRFANAGMMLYGVPEQHLVKAMGGLDLMAEAMRAFPDDKPVQNFCMKAIGSTILFNRPLGLYAGQRGMLEVCLRALTLWPDDPRTQHWGVMGCFFDAVPENRRVYLGLGGIEQQHAAMKRHYWDAEAVLEPWYAYSSICYDEHTAVRCAEVGAIEDGIQAMRDHPFTPRVREEVLQMTKAVSGNYREYAWRLVAAGAFEQYVKAINESLSDNHLVALSCENLAMQIGGAEAYSVQGVVPTWSFNATHQEVATDAGAAPAVFEALRNERNMAYNRGPKESGYDAGKACLQTLAILAYRHPGNQERLVRLGAHGEVVQTMQRYLGDDFAQRWGCRALRLLAAGEPGRRAAVESVRPASCRLDVRVELAGL